MKDKEIATETEEVKRDKAKDEKEARAVSQTIKKLSSAYLDYTQNKHRALTDYCKRHHDAYFELVRIQNDASMEAYRPVKEAYHNMIIACGVAHISEGGMRNYQAAHQEFVKAQTEYSNNTKVHDIHQRAYDDFSKTVEDADEDTRKRIEDAYGKFIDTLKTAWGSIDTKDINDQLLESVKRISAAA